MNYAEAIAHLHALGPELAPAAIGVGGALAPRRKFDLDHMRRLCTALGDPQHRVPSILIAGTNGKGSTAATLASILNAAGYRTGLYTSPHLVCVNERIQLSQPVLPSEYGSLTSRGSDGELALTEIHDADFARLYTRVDEAAQALVQDGTLPHAPSFFERLTAVAFLYFGESFTPAGQPRAEILVLEVGLGGRLDATNVVEPLISVITDIALDHQEFLGTTLTEIAGEKCGILRENGILVTLSQHPEANQAIGLAAARLDVRGVNAAIYLPPAQRNNEDRASGNWMERLRNRYLLSLQDSSEPGLLEVDSPLFGTHQQRNLALAIATAIELRDHFGYVIGNGVIGEGIRTTKWPGRLEVVWPNLLLDVAHNPAGAWTLRAAIAAVPDEMPRTLIFSCLRDKDLAEMSRILFPLFDASPDGDPLRRRDHLLLAPIPNARAASVSELLAAAEHLGVPAEPASSLSHALSLAHEITPTDGLIIATGSVYLVGELRHLALRPEEVLT
jgi:dihydrofolate synthase/folylpolyglutamate synthase